MYKVVCMSLDTLCSGTLFILTGLFVYLVLKVFEFLLISSDSNPFVNEWFINIFCDPPGHSFMMLLVCFNTQGFVLS